MGCEREEELGVHGNARRDGDLGLRKNWGSRGSLDEQSTRKEGRPERRGTWAALA